MKRELRYILINCFFAYSVYAGLFLDKNGFLNIALFMAWGTIIISFSLWINKVVDGAKEKLAYPAVPIWFDAIFDFSITFAFIYNGYIFLPIMYLFHMANAAYGRETAKKMINKAQNEPNKPLKND